MVDAMSCGDVMQLEVSVYRRGPRANQRLLTSEPRDMKGRRQDNCTALLCGGQGSEAATASDRMRMASRRGRLGARHKS